MKKVFYTTLVLSLFAVSALGQNRVILESNGVSSAFAGATAFQQAYEAATDGDVIYLPGMQYTQPGPISKRITIYGTGYHPEHTQATGITKISGNFSIAAGAAGSHFEGIWFIDNVSFAAARIDDVVIKRCYFAGNLTLSGLVDDLSENIRISENVINGSFNGNRTANLIFNNNIIINNTHDMFMNIGNNAWIYNNIIIGRGLLVTSTWTSRFMMRNITESLFENNIIFNTHTASYTYSDASNNTFNNNVFSYNPTNDETNTWSGNYTDFVIPDIFVNYTGVAFSFEADYNLENPESFPGTIGGQAGIYGGLQPFKANTRPFNPQILNFTISNSTDEEGKLDVDIEVEAQNN